MGFATFNTWGTIICQTDNHSYYNIYNSHENHNDNGNINNNYDNVNDNLNYIINDNTCNNNYMISMESNNNTDDIKTIPSAFLWHYTTIFMLNYPWVCSCMQSICGRVLENYFAAKIPKIQKTKHLGIPWTYNEWTFNASPPLK